MSDNDNNEETLVRSFTTYQVTPPSKFSFKSSEWTRWIRRFERFRIATELDKKPEEKQVNSLIYTMGDEADDIITSFGLSQEEMKSYETVKSKFENHFIAKRNVIFERAKFNVRVQNEGEPVESFITDLHCLAKYCDFGTLKDQLIRDRIVVGLRNKKLSEKLQLDSTLTLAKATEQARQSEEVKKQQSVIHGQTSHKHDEHNLDSVNKTKNRYGRERFSREKQRKIPDDKAKCTRCLGPHHARKSCPASDSVCNKCAKRGHWAKACRSQLKDHRNKRIGEVSRQETEENSSEDDAYFLGEVVNLEAISSSSNKPWNAEIAINNEKFEFKIDSGADVTVMPYTSYQQSKIQPNLKPTKKILMGPCKYKMDCKGTFLAQLRHEDSTTTEEIFVVNGLETPLLGRQAAQRLNLINRVDALDSNDRKQRIKEKYPNLFNGLGQMKDQEYEIKLTADAKPFAITVPRQVPIPLRKETEAELQRMERNGVIFRVEEPTEWCAPMVVTPKEDGKVRVCVDLTKLNEFVLRENHPLPTTDTTLGKLAGARYFSKLDANSGFWQIKLSERSRPLTTFITPWGRYCFNVLPFGISSGSEKFQKCMCKILEGLDGVECNIDDVLIYGRTKEEHDKRLEAVLQRLNNANVTLNAEKCVFCVSSVKFLGQIVGPDGIKPDPAKVRAILEMPPPTNVHEVRSFLGMVNQFSKFTTNLAVLTRPIRELLVKTNAWTWGPPQQDAFDKVKIALTSAPVLTLYDPNKETKIAADASSYGLGAVLLQEETPDTWKPVSFISRSMTATESKYAQIEKEALAVTWACERLSNFIIGKSIAVETDHKPLVPLLTKHTIDKLPPRLQRYKMRLMRFHIKEVRHIPGKQHYTADTLSRKIPMQQPSQATIADNDMNAYISSVINTLPASDPKLKEIQEAQDEDEICKRLKTYCLEQWPDKQQLPNALKPYWQVRGELTIVNGLLLKGTRLVIPPNLQRQTLDQIHEGHQGISKCRQRAKVSVWWPGISAQIKAIVEHCETCCKYRKQQAEPLLPTPLPERPWQLIATDLFELNKNTYLLIVDYYSRYVEVITLHKNTSSVAVIQALKTIFARHGIPDEVRSDNGPQYHCKEFVQFAKAWGFKHTTSSPRYPQSNGEVERAVRTVKDILKKEDDPTKALLAYRATPLASGYSPAELLMGRKIKSTIPIMPKQLMPSLPKKKQLRKKEEEYRSKQKSNFDYRHKVKQLEPLPSGSVVYITDMDCTGRVIKPLKEPRSYLVNTPKSVVRRNRIQLRNIPKNTDQRQNEEKITPPLNANNRPRRIIKLSLKARENLGLE